MKRRRFDFGVLRDINRGIEKRVRDIFIASALIILITALGILGYRYNKSNNRAVVYSHYARIDGREASASSLGESKKPVPEKYAATAVIADQTAAATASSEATDALTAFIAAIGAFVIFYFNIERFTDSFLAFPTKSPKRPMPYKR